MIRPSRSWITHCLIIAAACSSADSSEDARPEGIAALPALEMDAATSRLSGCYDVQYVVDPVAASQVSFPGVYSGQHTDQFYLSRERTSSTSWRLPYAPVALAVRSDSGGGALSNLSEEPYWYPGRGDSVWVERTFQFDRIHIALLVASDSVIGRGHFHFDPMGLIEFPVRGRRLACAPSERVVEPAAAEADASSAIGGLTSR